MKNYTFTNKNSTNSGFTLIEVMIAVGLFTVVMVVGVGAVLNINTLYKKTQKIRSLIDNTGFVMEDLTRTIRTGTGYSCGYPQSITSNGSTVTASIGNTVPSPADCFISTHQITLTPAGKSNTDPLDQTVYILYALDQNHPEAGTLFKSTDGGGSYSALSPKEVQIDTTKSGFIVTGADTANTTDQPRVRINLGGRIMYRDDSTPFMFQTTIVSRVPKINP